MKNITKKFIVLLVIAAILLTVFAVSTFEFKTKRVAAADGEVLNYGVLSVHFIDVGQGDACVIIFPDGKNMLIDTGDNGDSAKAAVEYINKLGIKEFDYFVMTHSDEDHIGGVDDIFEKGGITAKVVYRPSQVAYDKDNSSYKDPALSLTGIDYTFPYETDGIDKGTMKSTVVYRNALQICYGMADEVYMINPNNDNTNCIKGSVTVDGVTEEYSFNFYSPVEPPYADENNYSPIMVLEYAGRNFVMSGDAEEENEEQFVNLVRNSNKDDRYDIFRTQDFHADVIKMGHHGSSTSSSEDYLEIMTPNLSLRANTYTVFSCNSEGNNYEHPHYTTLKRVIDMDYSAERIVRTDLMGDLTFNVSVIGEMMFDEEKDGVTDEEKLISGAGITDKYPAIKDNDVDPTESNGSVPIDPVPNPVDPEPSDPTEPNDPIEPSDPTEPNDPLGEVLGFWDSLTSTQKIILVVIIAVVVITIIVIAIFLYSKKKKKKYR